MMACIELHTRQQNLQVCLQNASTAHVRGCGCIQTKAIYE